ncbi:MAG: hypothetical protein COV99_01575 [Bacteroidetes bacterium CG12_big_fil_rev_8_21_14_0_65_60_17]|nr:MAG: hypothetical protein COV99_01575 [Bacteroidetes bacterium CG12_big_fil_rev_8_21_14_0_65_60_17]
MKNEPASAPILVAALYRFHPVPDTEAAQAALQRVMEQHAVRGTLLVADEGINGTIAGARDNVHAVLAEIRGIEGFGDLIHKESEAAEMPFLRAKVRLKKEIVTLGVDGVDPNRVVGTYVPPEDWNRLISDPATILVDTRNDYEVEVGTFRGARNPQTTSFREFPDYVERELAGHETEPIAMFCTGGIRCEKATSYLRSRGFEKVFHLEGGILNYLERVPADESLWEGECFVFDNRVTVNHALEPGTYAMCHACRMPVTEKDMTLPSWEEGVSCLYCHAERTEADRERLRERQRQLELSRERGIPHIGQDAREYLESAASTR